MKVGKLYSYKFLNIIRSFSYGIKTSKSCLRGLFVYDLHTKKSVIVLKKFAESDVNTLIAAVLIVIKRQKNYLIFLRIRTLISISENHNIDKKINEMKDTSLEKEYVDEGSRPTYVNFKKYSKVLGRN